jgi:sulfite exporter TauE/SafE
LRGRAAGGAAGRAAYWIAAAQAADRLARLPAGQFCERRRLASGMLLSYHLGRLATYALLGAILGATGGAVARLPWSGTLNGALLLLAAGLFLAHALGRVITAPRAAQRWRAAGHWSRAVARLASRARRWRPESGLLIGLTLGFLPCGFLYGALAAAAATGSAGLGALAMLAFGAGTVPTLAALGIAGGAAGQFGNRLLQRATPLVLGVNATLLGTLGIGMLMR